MQKLRLALVAGLAIFSQSAQAAANLAAVSGIVIVHQSGMNRRLDAFSLVPLPLSDGDAVETTGNGHARVVLDDQSEVSLAPGSELKIGPATKAGRGSMLELLYGKMRAFVTKRMNSEKDWSIKSGDAMMGVRGTEFIVDTNRDRTLLCTFEGDVEARLQQGPPTRVTANQGIIMGNDGRVSAPVTMDPHQMDWWRHETLVDSSGSGETRARVLGTDWQWGGPPGVEYLDPNQSFSQYSLLNANAALWSRVNGSGNLASVGAPAQDTSFTSRLAVNATATPNRSYLVYLQATAAVKSGHTNPEQTGIHINQGFFLARSQSTHSIAVGRQDWSFGDGLIIGDDPWSPFTRHYDGVLATGRWAPARLRLFASSLEDRKTDPNLEDWLSGAYAEFSELPLALYGLWVKRGGANDIATANNLQARFGVLGARSEVTTLAPFVADAELAFERGRIGLGDADTRTLSALLAYVDAGLGWQLGTLSGAIKGVYLRASGGGQSGDSYGAFIPVANDTHRFLGLVDAFPQIRNIQRAGATVTTRYSLLGKPLSSRLDYSHFTRVDTQDVAYPVVLHPENATLGDEVDLQLSLELVPQLFMQLGGGVLWPGAAYASGAPPVYMVFASGQIRI